MVINKEIKTHLKYFSRKRSTTPSYRIIVGVSDQVTVGTPWELKIKRLIIRRLKISLVKFNSRRVLVNMNKSGKNQLSNLSQIFLIEVLQRNEF